MAPDLEELEAWWHDRPVDGVLPGCHPWLPYPLPEFRLLLQAAIDVAAGSRFLGVGCGVGTKLLVAAEYGLDATGLEVVPAYITEAARAGVRVIHADARTWNRYAEWDIVYCNQPLSDEGAEILLEQRIQAQMRPGQVLIAVNSFAPPADGLEVLASLAACDLVAVKR